MDLEAGGSVVKHFSSDVNVAPSSTTHPMAEDHWIPSKKWQFWGIPNFRANTNCLWLLQFAMVITMALIEIDGLPFLKMAGFTMANCNK